MSRRSYRSLVFLSAAILTVACGSTDAFQALTGPGSDDASGGSGGDSASAADARSELASFSRPDGAGGTSGTGGAASTGGASGDNGNAGANVDGQAGGAAPADAGRDVCVPSGAGDNLGRDPAVNACGGTTCQYSTSYCCAPRNAAAPTCLASPYGSDKSACLNKGAVPITCDEKAKCQHSSVCCGMMGDGGDVAVVSCFEKVDCQSPNLLICGSDADCLIGQRCVARTVHGEKLGVCEAAIACQ